MNGQIRQNATTRVSNTKVNESFSNEMDEIIANSHHELDIVDYLMLGMLVFFSLVSGLIVIALNNL